MYIKPTLKCCLSSNAAHPQHNYENSVLLQKVNSSKSVPLFLLVWYEKKWVNDFREFEFTNLLKTYPYFKIFPVFETFLLKKGH